MKHFAVLLDRCLACFDLQPLSTERNEKGNYEKKIENPLFRSLC